MKAGDFMIDHKQLIQAALDSMPNSYAPYSSYNVSAAVLCSSGKIYTGVCIDTCSTLGICAERNAIFNMITNGEQEIDKVLCIPPVEGRGAPCGACRELMVQLMPDSYKDIEIMIDYKKNIVMKLGELTPEWWI